MYSSTKFLSSKILISGIPRQTRFEDIEPLLKQFGTVEQCEAVTSKDPNTQTVHITFSNHEQAQRAASGLNGVEFEGNKLHAESLDKQQQKRGGTGSGNSNRGGSSATRTQYTNMPGPGRQADFPLRLLVQSEMVGAIIGRQGTTIRTITQQSRARVDVHRKDNVGSLEKAITIYGNPENCTNACKRILEVMQQEATNTNKGEICLKILAHNNLIGRIIGKSGNTIKRIMQETDTKITVSSINDINSFNLERIITVKGTIDNMSKAESQISSKLRQSYENDLQAMAPQSLMFPGLHPMAMMSTPGNGMVFNPGMPGGYPPCPGFPIAKNPATIVPPVFPNDMQETTFLYIPNNAVGAIIGTKGSHIRNIMRFSGASVKIAPLEADKPLDQQTERKVTIVGTPEGQWKAQYMIFEKMKEEGFLCGTDDVRLTVEILVASSQVGRIIGKGGQNVRELQRVTGSQIKLPEHNSSPPADEETTVHIVGPFYSVQSAQRRIRAMMMSTNPPPVTKKQKAAKEQTTSSSGSATQSQQSQQQQQSSSSQ
ncbi:insulin-like growth factor 2 mRNA-binding protein 1 isoform X2 [Condylostylus longicornis]|uniref:insulin-like growth factor 2 mRNA-binding protein 1 isoform X2 n=1 Tax=Condylostylus longicornis TaxID=2530218 RepID=UPI00244E4D70|nr:insulin-like growth factor 2 mRNA-binding protein 1 isoform X2 [Condylostylus longicornis]